MEAAVFEPADLQAMLSEKIAFISQNAVHTATPVESDPSATDTTQHSTDAEEKIPELEPIEKNSIVEPSEQPGESHSQIVHDRPGHDPSLLYSTACIRND